MKCVTKNSLFTLYHTEKKGILYVSSGGGTGRRVRLRGVWEQSCGGSSPLLSTNFRHPVASYSLRQSEIDGTGRRVRLRGVWEQSCGGSSPLLSTNFRHPVASYSLRQSEIDGTGRRVRLRGVWEQSCGRFLLCRNLTGGVSRCSRC